MQPPQLTGEAFLAHLEQLFTEHEDGATGMEALSIADHMLQTAAAAQANGAENSLIAASLLHDIGHWLDAEFGDDVPQTDLHHENLGASYLRNHFGPQVYRPVGLHVAAKRYLCTREPQYLAELSPASTHTLELQGGVMSESETRAFEKIPEHEDAVRLRRWDEYGKIPDLDVPGFAHYRDLLRSLLVAP